MSIIERVPTLLPDFFDELIHKDYLFLDRTFNPRHEKPDKSLVDNIRDRDGYQVPIAVFKYNKHKYGVGGGWQRVIAGIQIGYTMFPCKIFENINDLLDYLDSSYLVKKLSNRAAINNIIIHYNHYKGDIDFVAKKLHKDRTIIERRIAISKHLSLMILISKPHERKTPDDWRFIYDVGGRDIKKKSLTLEIAELLAMKLHGFSEEDIGKIAVILMKKKKRYNGKIDRILNYIISNSDRNDYKKLIDEFMGIKKKRPINVNIDSLTNDERELMDSYKKMMRIKSDSELFMRLLKRQLILYKYGFIGNSTRGMKEVSFMVGTQEICIRSGHKDGFKIAIFNDKGFYIDYKADEISKKLWNKNSLVLTPIKKILNTIKLK